MSSADVDGIAGAIELGSGLIDEDEWANFEQSMRDRVRDEQLIKFEDDGSDTTAHFSDLARTCASTAPRFR